MVQRSQGSKDFHVSLSGAGEKERKRRESSFDATNQRLCSIHHSPSVSCSSPRAMKSLLFHNFRHPFQRLCTQKRSIKSWIRCKTEERVVSKCLAGGLCWVRVSQTQCQLARRSLRWRMSSGKQLGVVDSLRWFEAVFSVLSNPPAVRLFYVVRQ